MKSFIKENKYLVLILAVPLIGFAAFVSYQWFSGIPNADAESLLNVDAQYEYLLETEFLNQAGEPVQIKDMNGKVHLVNFFFARCPTICPKMNGHLTDIQNQFRGVESFKIMSFSIDPERDDVAALADYAINYESEPNQWHLLTGEKSAIYLAARNIYKIVAVDTKQADKDFIHSDLVILVDQNQKIRQYYKGTDDSEMKQLAKDVESLINETSI